MEAVQFSIFNKGNISTSSCAGSEINTNVSVISEKETTVVKTEAYMDSENVKSVAALQIRQCAYQCAQEITERIKELMDPTAGMSEAEKASYDKKVMAKIYSGKELTSEELRYIRMNYPAMYPQVLRVQIQRKAFEERIKHCHSKQEVEDAYQEVMMHVSEDDPMRTVLYAAYTDVYKEFKESEDYEKLPEKSEEEEKNDN